MKDYIKLLRVHHYIKNLLVFTALACSGQLFDREKFIAGLAGFIAFCLVSSAVYVINDILDAEKDRNHPTKCKRPIAAGRIAKTRAWWISAVLVLTAAACNGCVFHLSSSLLLVVYLLLNLGYSMGLKDVPLLDVAILVSGFYVRILYGAVITGITISNWLYLTVIAMAFYFALGKRRNELVQAGGLHTRQVLKYYTASFLSQNMYLCLTLANVFYALWSMDESTVELYGNKSLAFTVPLVLLICMKYSLNIEGGSDGDPVEVLLHDKVLLGLCVVYLAVMFLILYL